MLDKNVSVKYMLKWYRYGNTEYKSATIVRDSMSTMEKLKNGMLYDWKELMRSSNLSRVVWIFCPGHADVAGNERADMLAGETVLGQAVPLDLVTVIATLAEIMVQQQ